MLINLYAYYELFNIKYKTYVIYCIPAVILYLACLIFTKINPYLVFNITLSGTLLFFNRKCINKEFLILIFNVIISLFYVKYKFYCLVASSTIDFIYMHKEAVQRVKTMVVVVIYQCFAIGIYIFNENPIIMYFYFVSIMAFEIMYSSIIKNEEAKNICYQNKLLKQQVDEVHSIYMTMRGWRHDYHNHLQSLKGYLHLQQLDNMRSYLNNLDVELNKIDTLYHSGNVNVDAILNSKLNIAKEEKIQLTVTSKVPSVLTVNDIDLCVVIGNLLDNAIESCRNIDMEEDKFIRVYISVLKEQLYICITNATKESVKMRNEAYFSKKRGDHGHGLKRVDNVVEKYNGYLNRQNEPGVFATEIVLPL